MRCHQSATFLMTVCWNDRSWLRRSSGKSALSVARLSPRRLTSIGYLRLSILPERSICTPRACPMGGRKLAYGNELPTTNRVSAFCIISQLGLVPSSPIELVQYGMSSGTAALPRRALAMPAPRVSATASSSSVASSAPAPTSIATFFPAFKTSAALWSSSSVGRPRSRTKPMPVWTDLMDCGCSAAFISWTSAGMITAVTVRSAAAMRMARSMQCCNAEGTFTCWTYALATSL